MSRLRTHAKRELSYDPQTTGVVWTLCQKHVEQNQIAAFVPEGVTCKNCLASIKWSEENEGLWRREGFRVGQLVEAGAEGTDEHDAGRILAIEGDMAEVGWESGTRTRIAIADLRGGGEG